MAVAWPALVPVFLLSWAHKCRAHGAIRVDVVYLHTQLLTGGPVRLAAPIAWSHPNPCLAANGKMRVLLSIFVGVFIIVNFTILDKWSFAYLLEKVRHGKDGPPGLIGYNENCPEDITGVG